MSSNKEPEFDSHAQYIINPDLHGSDFQDKLREALQLDYFHPDLTTMQQIKYALLPYIDKEGSFILRRSLTQPNQLTVSAVHQHAIVHFKIQQKLNKYYLQTKLFDSVEELIKYYGTCDVPNLEGVEGVRLLHPVDYSGYTELKSVKKFNSDMRRSSSQSIVSVGFTADKASFETHKELSQNGQNSQVSPPLGSAVMCRKDDFEKCEQNGTSSAQALAPSKTARSGNKQQRPPIPLPPGVEKKSSDGIYNGLYYSNVKQENKLPELLAQLDMDPSDMTSCECGLDMNLSELPQGWTVHISRDENCFYGRPFFMSPSQSTSWELPQDVYLDLDHKQQRLIKLLTEYYTRKRGPPDKDTMKQWSISLSKTTQL